MNASNHAFKMIEQLVEQMDRIEVLLGRLADAKDDRETAKELSAVVDAKTEALKQAIPPGAPQP